MSYLVLGVALLAAFLIGARWYATANVKTLKKVLFYVFGILAVVLALFFVITGRLGWAVFALSALIPMLLRARTAYRAARNFSRMAGAGQGAPTGQTSDVETRFLRMGLDHDTGDVWGEVIDGPYKGRRLDDMTASEKLDLLRNCWTEDEASARVLEAYLDRVHPDWRDHAEDAGPKTGGAGPARSGAMTRAEALAVLGLSEGANRQNIKAAYQRIISGLHPDHGGSDYLAAQVNEAKDVLLGD
ncbi:MAG TPA: molecular chaperone DnaJ [Rhodospirillaceae bacterium]|nr:molecular chaperone DnaJ [Magnetovibrio sp.]HCS72086.1 molecular chaperone DnaJ [Rhodospirillaceae bacterium]|tara:strand:+ start:784 stop:1515 length:732 start_codon:yes stop_codon:yes gene_type:complete